MKPGSNRRPRTRPNNSNINNNSSKRQGGRSSYDSNGPDGKVRGTAQQVLEKYQALGRDATSAGDRVSAEAYFQFAEHYYRVVNAEGGGPQPRREIRPNEEAELETTENEQVAPSVAAQAAPAPKPRPKQPAVEVLNVPIMPEPIDVLIAEEQSQPYRMIKFKSLLWLLTMMRQRISQNLFAGVVHGLSLRLKSRV